MIGNPAFSAILNAKQAAKLKTKLHLLLNGLLLATQTRTGVDESLCMQIKSNEDRRIEMNARKTGMKNDNEY
jgi:hypothetical protein